MKELNKLCKRIQINIIIEGIASMLIFVIIMVMFIKHGVLPGILSVCLIAAFSVYVEFKDSYKKGKDVLNKIEKVMDIVRKNKESNNE